MVHYLLSGQNLHLLEIAAGFDLLAFGCASVVANRQRHVIRAANQRNNQTRLYYLCGAKDRFHRERNLTAFPIDLHPGLQHNDALRNFNDLSAIPAEEEQHLATVSNEIPRHISVVGLLKAPSRKNDADARSSRALDLTLRLKVHSHRLYKRIDAVTVDA
jgi:hypothetical protein